MELIKNNVRVTLEHIGEGFYGDYNPNDADDRPLLRFDVATLADDGVWEGVEDSSYCTQLPDTLSDEHKERALAFIMDEVYEAASSGKSIKKCCENLSWISPESIETGKLTAGKFFHGR